MSEETRPSRAETDGLESNGRRQYLKYLAAGAVGGVTGLGLDRLIWDPIADDIGPVDRSSKDDLEMYDVYVRETNAGYEAFDATGEKIVAGKDGWNVLNTAISAAPEGGVVYVTGRYRGTSTIDVQKSITVIGQEAVIDHRQAGEFAFRFEGAQRYETTLGAPVSTGTSTVQLKNTADIEKGDIILLRDKDGEAVLGRRHTPGEAHSVLDVDGNAVIFEDSIVWRGGYPSGTSAYVIDPIEVHMSGFNLTAPAKDENYYGVTAHRCRDSTFENLRLDKFGSRGILLEACANVRVRDCTILQSTDIKEGDGYGIQIWAGCHDILVEGCSAKECRHALSVTAGGDLEIPSRSITFRDCFVSAVGSAALNCHGGSAHDVRFEGCVVHTAGTPGVRTGAQKTVVTGCEFRMDGHNAIDTRDDGQEMILSITDSDIYGSSVVHLDGDEGYEREPLWKLVHLDGVRAYGCARFFEVDAGAINRVRNLIIRGCYWDEVSSEGMRFENQIDGGIIEGNDFGAAPNESHIVARNGSDTNVTNLHIVNNRFQRPTGLHPFIRLANSRQCVVSGNRFESAADVRIYEGERNSTANRITQNTYYAPNASPDPVDENVGSVAEDNYVFDTAAGEWR